MFLKQSRESVKFIKVSHLSLWENQNGKIVLLDFNEIKKIADIKEATEKIQLVESVFGMTVDQYSMVSLQRFDAEWGQFVDVEMKEVKNRDKLKMKIVKSNLHIRKPLTQLQTSTDVNLEMSTTGCSTLLAILAKRQLIE